MLDTVASRKQIAADIAQWVQQEFQTLDLGDQRREDRVRLIVSQFAQQPASSLPAACGDAAQLKAAYRLFDNQEVSPQALLQAHVDQTLQRMQAYPMVLAVQDTTGLNYANHFCTEGLGPINNQRRSRGYFLHTTLVVSTSGLALGCLAAETFHRSAKKFGTRRNSQVRNNEPLADKESQRWLNSLQACERAARQCPATLIVNIADREADIYEGFAQCVQSKLTHLLVRVQHNRNVAGEHQRLWPHLERQPIAGQLCVQVPRSDGKPARSATLAIRFCRVQVSAPCLKAQEPALDLWAVEAREIHPPQGQKPILWRLLTTLAVETVAKAMECVGWYAKRWQIEVLHKVLKSGCQVEGRQLQTRERLDRALMLNLPVAWRVIYLMQVSREQPEQAATVHLSEVELKILWERFQDRRSHLALSDRALSMEQAVYWIARMGGFLGRKSDGNPGPLTIWRGLQRLRDLADMIPLLKNVGNV